MSRMIAVACALAGAAILFVAVTGDGPDEVGATGFIAGPVLLLTAALLWWTGGLVAAGPKRPKMRESLQTATATMQAFSQQAANTTRLRQAGLRTTAVVRSSRDARAMVNLMPLIELELDVAVAGGAPVTIRHSTPVPHNALGMTTPGIVVVVYVDPADTNQLIVAWDERPTAHDSVR